MEREHATEKADLPHDYDHDLTVAGPWCKLCGRPERASIHQERPEQASSGETIPRETGT